MPADIRIGDLRWPVVLCRREQQPDPDSSGYVDVFTNRRNAMASIQPVGTFAYLNGVQLGEEVTHKITIRWRHDINADDVVVRELMLPDGQTRNEVYKIRRWMDRGGRQRFVEIEAVIERGEVRP